MKNKKVCFILILIIIFAFITRIFQLDTNPAGFFCDEAANGYNAYSILTTGRDEYGKSFPLFFRSFNDYKNPVFIYSTIPFVAIFGLSEYSVRLTMIIYGLLTIVAVYFLGKELFNSKIALIVAFLTSILPWHIHLSRIGLELIPSVFWITLGIFFLYKSLKRFLCYPLGIFSFILGFLSCNPTKLLIPPLFVFFLLVNFLITSKWLKERRFWLTNFVFGLAFFLAVWPYLQDGTFFARWNQVAVNDQSKVNILQGYLNHFSFDFLFKKGDIDFPGQFITRHSIRGIGELYWWQLPFILIGLSKILYVKKYQNNLIFLLIILLLYPLGSIFTGTAPQATRSVYGMIPLVFFTAVGSYYFFIYVHKKKSKIFSSTVIFIFLCFVCASFSHFVKLLAEYPLYSSNFWGWQYGPREIMKYFLTVKDQYDDLYMSGEYNGGEIFLKFYDPENTCQGKCKMGDFWRNPVIYDPSRRQLFALSPDYLNQSKFKNNFSTKKILKYPNGEVAFFIGEISL